MTKQRITQGALIAASVAGLFACASSGAGTGMSGSGAATSGVVQCGGINSCKGQGSCAGNENACKAKNGCKGKGWVETTAADCQAKGGVVVAMHKGM